MKHKSPSILIKCLLLASALGISGCSSANPGGTRAPADFLVAGSWQSAFRCEANNPAFACFTGNDTLTLTQEGSAAQPGNKVFSRTIMGAAFPASSAAGRTFTWSGTGAGSTEEGTWEFSDAQNFSKTTSYERTDGSGGDCEGDGAEASLPVPVAPACPGMRFF